MRRWFDTLQFMLHAQGLHRAASFVGRFGTPATYPKLRIIDFDPKWKAGRGIEAHEVAWPSSRYDVN